MKLGVILLIKTKDKGYNKKITILKRTQPKWFTESQK